MTDTDNTIVVDHRDRDLIPIFRGSDKMKKWDFQMATLPIGDVNYNEIIIERKRADDLVQSVMDGRIFNQALNMSQSEMLPVLIVVGTLEEWMPQWRKWSKYQVKVDSALVYGAFASMIIRYGISCAWVPDDVSLCRLALKICEKHKEKKTAIPSKIQLMVKNRDIRVDYLKLLYGLAEKPAVAVLSKGKTLEGVMKLKYSELIDITGVGEITADKIVKLNQMEEPYRR